MNLEQDCQLWPYYDSSVLSDLPRIAAMPDLGAVDCHPVISAFEAGFSDYLGGGRATFYNSGTSAFAAALFALDLPVGSEVIVPSHSFRGTVTPLFQFGLIPVLVSCDAFGSIDPEAVRQAINPRTRAVVVNHQWGLPAEVERIADLTRRHSLKLIEDASHAHATRVFGRAAGTYGDMAFFSCGTTKLVSGGLGGILFSRNSDLVDRALVFGQAKHRCISEICDPEILSLGRLGVGVNLRGHPLAAHLAHSHLKCIRRVSERKGRNLSEFEAMLAQFVPIITPLPRPARWCGGVWYKLPCRLVDPRLKTKLVQTAADVGIRLKPCDPPLAMQFTESFGRNSDLLASRRFNFSYIDLSDGCKLDDLVLFDTRDMYGEVDWSLYRQKLSCWVEALKAQGVQV